MALKSLLKLPLCSSPTIDVDLIIVEAQSHLCKGKSKAFSSQILDTDYSYLTNYGKENSEESSKKKIHNYESDWNLT